MSNAELSIDDALQALARRGTDVFVLSLGIGGRLTTANTRHYFDWRGWSGLVVEAAPELFAGLQSRLGGRSAVRLEQLAIAETTGEVELLAIPPRAFEFGGAPPEMANRASLLPVRAAILSKHYRALAETWGRPTLVPATPLADVLDRHAVTRVDLLQIDARGYEWSIFAQFDLDRFRPSIIRLGWAHVPANERAQIVRRLERRGYTVNAEGAELIAITPEIAAPPQPAPGPQAEDEIVLYAITFNWPEQFERWLRSVEIAAPELLQLPRKFLLDNSTRVETRGAYDELARRHGWTVMRHGNLGICGGRYFCAQHFEELPRAWGMLWFEDDMLLARPGSGVCRNGLATHIPALLDRARAVVVKEDLDYLKLSFSEFYGDHHLNWAWYNVPEVVRQQEFPDGTYRTKIKYTGSDEGVSYVVGELHYSNWPTLMTRRGNARLFLAKPYPLHEQHYMADAFTLMRAGHLRAGALLASPIAHDRVYHYPGEERKEL